MMSRTINSDQILKNILKYFHKMEEMDILEINKMKSNYFFVVENWLTLYIESSYIQNFFLDLQKTDFNYISFFKYLKVVCLTLINFLNIIGEIDYIKFKSIFCPNFNLISDNVFFKYEPNKDKAKKLLSDSLGNLAIEIQNNYQNNNYCSYKTKIEFGYYYNNEVNNFVETYSGIILYDFFMNKILNILIYIDMLRHEYRIYKSALNEEVSKKKKKNKEKDIKEIPYRIFTLFNKFLQEGKKEDINRYLMPYVCNYKDLNNILNLFDFSKYKNLLSNYLQNTSHEILEPDCRYYAYKIYKYFYDIYFAYIYPIYNFNTLLSKFCNNENNICFVESSNRYKHYDSFIDFFELIKAIFNTEFNKNEKLNVYFKKELINFLINSDYSLIYIFIQEVYNLIKNEMVKRGETNRKIQYKFKIKIQQGFKYSDKFVKKIKEEIISNIINKGKKENFNIKPNENEFKEKKEENKININNEINNKNEKNKNGKNIINEINTSNEINISNEINLTSNINNDTNNSNNMLPQKKKKFKLKLNRKINDVNNMNNQNLFSTDNKTRNSLDIKNNDNGIIVIKNLYKRKSTPICGYSGFVPNNDNIIGKSSSSHLKSIFNNEIIFVNKNEYKESIKLKKKEKKGKNIFNIIFKN